MFNWFAENEMKASADRCHLILNCSDRKQIKINNETIKSSNYEKLLGIQIDKKLTFNEHVVGLCQKASQKIVINIRNTTKSTHIRSQKHR